MHQHWLSDTDMRERSKEMMLYGSVVTVLIISEFKQGKIFSES